MMPIKCDNQVVLAEFLSMSGHAGLSEFVPADEVGKPGGALCMNFRTTILAIVLAVVISPTLTAAEGSPQPDLMNLAAGVIPTGVEIDGGGQLGTTLNQALRLIDGHAGGFVLTPKGGTREAKVRLLYALPALTTFEVFSVPNVLETPSPSQTFFRRVQIHGSDAGPQGPYSELACTILTVHQSKGEQTRFEASILRPVRWIQVTLSGGISVERDRTFFEFSELIGYGKRESVPQSRDFAGKWKGRGVKLDLRQDGDAVSGCYDTQGDLQGNVIGNLLYATGKDRNSGVKSAFVLAVGEDQDIVGVRSSNGAPFTLYRGAKTENLKTRCSDKGMALPGCGSTLHGIRFDFDSADIRPESGLLLDLLFEGLMREESRQIKILGHTSSEGPEDYNQSLSQRRAEAVVAALADRGISAARLASAGRGEAQPIADNGTETGRSLNRRVEILCQ